MSWVLLNQLAIGALPRAGEGAILAKAKIKAVLSLCAPSEGKLPDDIVRNFRCMRFILPDSQFVLGLEVSQLESAVDLLHQAIQKHGSVYVHCVAGVERSPTVCIAYLCLHHNMELWEALNFLKQARSRAMPTEAQIQVIRALIKKVDEEAALHQLKE